MKKFLALLLAALMVLGCANLSLAEDAAPLDLLHHSIRIEVSGRTSA